MGLVGKLVVGTVAVAAIVASGGTAEDEQNAEESVSFIVGSIKNGLQIATSGAVGGLTEGAPAPAAPPKAGAAQTSGR